MRLEQAPKPVPKPGQVLVKVRAASVNPIDWKMRRGMMAKVFPIDFPRVLGRDCAGELEGGLVAGVSDPRTDGTHAEYALLPADQAAPIPEGLSPERLLLSILRLGGYQTWFAAAFLVLAREPNEQRGIEAVHRKDL